MNFGFTEEQAFLRDAVRRFLDGQSPVSEVRRVMATPEGSSEALWKQLSELGWVGLIVPEEHGGAGLSWLELIIVFEETGRSLLPSALLSTALAQSAILDNANIEQQRRWLPGLADGSRIGTLALLEASDHLAPEGIDLRARRDGVDLLIDGEKRFVTDGNRADLFVTALRTGDAPGDIALAVIDRNATGVSTSRVPSLDETKQMASLHFEGVRVKPGDILGAASGRGWAAVERLLDQGAVAVTAEAVGAAEASHAITVQYARDRVQFGQPIGHFQGVKHPLADMYVDLETIKSLLYYAAWAVDHDRDELPRHASLAKSYIAEAFSRIGVECVQLHGAVGYTEEYDVQLYLKRSKWVRPMFGDADHHLDRIADLRGL